jgi:hypothetical protein
MAWLCESPHPCLLSRESLTSRSSDNRAVPTLFKLAMPSWTLTLRLQAVPTSVISGRLLRREAWDQVRSTRLARGQVALRCQAGVECR